jgi:hypothetical protein
VIDLANRARSIGATPNTEIMEHREAAQTKHPLPTIETVLDSPCTSRWLSEALVVSQKRDDLDALRDAQFLARLLAEEYKRNHS